MNAELWRVSVAPATHRHASANPLRRRSAENAAQRSSASTMNSVARLSVMTRKALPRT